MINQAVNLALLAGQVLSQSGAEAYRIEDTCQRLLIAAGFTDSSVLVITTGILISVQDEQSAITRVRRVHGRAMNLEKIDRVNTLSRSFANGSLSIQAATQLLHEIDAESPTFNSWLQYLCAGIASASFAYLFGAVVTDLPAALLGGALTFAIVLKTRQVAPRFFADFLAAFIAAMYAILLSTTILVQNSSHVIIGAIMVLVPGVLITTAVSDALSDDLISSIGKVTEAVYIATAVAGGVTLALTLGEVLFSG